MSLCIVSQEQGAQSVQLSSSLQWSLNTVRFFIVWESHPTLSKAWRCIFVATSCDSTIWAALRCARCWCPRFGNERVSVCSTLCSGTWQKAPFIAQGVATSLPELAVCDRLEGDGSAFCNFKRLFRAVVVQAKLRRILIWNVDSV